MNWALIQVVASVVIIVILVPVIYAWAKHNGYHEGWAEREQAFFTEADRILPTPLTISGVAPVTVAGFTRKDFDKNPWWDRRKTDPDVCNYLDIWKAGIREDTPCFVLVYLGLDPHGQPVKK